MSKIVFLNSQSKFLKGLFIRTKNALSLMVVIEAKIHFHRMTIIDHPQQSSVKRRAANNKIALRRAINKFV